MIEKEMITVELTAELTAELVGINDGVKVWFILVNHQPMANDGHFY